MRKDNIIERIRGSKMDRLIYDFFCGNAKEISRSRGIAYENIIDFSANINPMGMPESAKEAIINNLDAIEKYPDITYFELKNSIKDFENSKIHEKQLKIENEEIILGNGAAEVLFNVVKAIEPKNVLIPAPTFSEYEEAVNAVKGNVNLYYLKEVLLKYNLLLLRF